MPLQQVLNGIGSLITAYVPGIETVADVSNVIASAGVSQIAIAAPVPPALRSGWIFQNMGIADMFINELGIAAVGVPTPGNASYVLSPRQTIGTTVACTVQVPLTNLAVSVLSGNAGDAYMARSW